VKVFFVAFHASLSRGRLGAARRKLGKLLADESVDFQPLTVGEDVRPAITRLVLESRAAPVVAIDDEYPLPDRAPWLADLTREVLTLEPRYRPQLVYVTRKATAAGAAQAFRHAVVRKYIQRDEKGHWVKTVAEAVVDLAEQLKLITSSSVVPPPAAPNIVGASPCFRDAVEELVHVVQSPYGMVTGERGVGKMFLIRAVWREVSGKPRVIVLPCRSFFKDYFVAGSHRLFAGGREAVDQLTPYLKEANRGLLVLHDVEHLPTGLQDELAVRLASSVAGPDRATLVAGMDSDGLQEHDVRIIATSTHSPELLRQTGRVIPDLASKLRKRHVRIPSLADRGTSDVRLLCNDIARRIAQRQGLAGAPEFEEETLSLLAGTTWPENLSDLVRVLEHAVWRSRGGMIRRSHLPDRSAAPSVSRPPTLDEITAQAQRAAIANALEETGGNVAAAAALLGRERGGLYRLMANLGMTRKSR
jgi:DNA-binding NtrC family response regulator